MAAKNQTVAQESRIDVQPISAQPIKAQPRVYSPDATLSDLFDMANADKASKGSAGRSLKSETRTGSLTVEGLFATDSLEDIAGAVLAAEETRKATIKSKPRPGHENKIGARNVTIGSNETTAKMLTHTVYVN